MEIKKIIINKENLKKSPPEERKFFYLAGWFLTEICLLKKLLYLSMNMNKIEDPYPSIEMFGRNYRTTFLSCILGAKLYEGWLLLQRFYFPNKIDANYNKNYNDEAREALVAIKKYFKRENIIYKIRNSTFHYPTKEEENDDSDTRFITESDYYAEYYIGKTCEQSIYLVHRFLDNFKKQVGGNDLKESIHKYTSEVFGITRNFCNIMNDHILLYQRKYGFSEDTFELKNPELGKDIYIPFFFEDK